MRVNFVLWCANVAPQNRQDKQRMTQGKHGDGDEQRRGKRQRGRLKGAAKNARAGLTGRKAIAATMDNATGRRDAQTQPGLQRTGATAPGRGDADAAGIPTEGEGTSGDVSGYVPTSEDLRLRGVYRDWVHGNLGTHLDGGVADDSAWKA